MANDDHCRCRSVAAATGPLPAMVRPFAQPDLRSPNLAAITLRAEAIHRASQQGCCLTLGRMAPASHQYAPSWGGTADLSLLDRLRKLFVWGPVFAARRSTTQVSSQCPQYRPDARINHLVVG